MRSWIPKQWKPGVDSVLVDHLLLRVWVQSSAAAPHLWVPPLAHHNQVWESRTSQQQRGEKSRATNGRQGEKSGKKTTILFSYTASWHVSCQTHKQLPDLLRNPWGPRCFSLRWELPPTNSARGVLYTNSLPQMVEVWEASSLPSLPVPEDAAKAVHPIFFPRKYFTATMGQESNSRKQQHKRRIITKVQSSTWSRSGESYQQEGLFFFSIHRGR